MCLKTLFVDEKYCIHVNLRICIITFSLLDILRAVNPLEKQLETRMQAFTSYRHMLCDLVDVLLVSMPGSRSWA